MGAGGKTSEGFESSIVMANGRVRGGRLGWRDWYST